MIRVIYCILMCKLLIMVTEKAISSCELILNDLGALHSTTMILSKLPTLPELSQIKIIQTKSFLLKQEPSS